MLNNKAIHFFKNISYALTSNIVSLSISTLVILIIPRYIGVSEYGYLQLYIFYTSFVGFLHFGWNDGIYLRYGGKDYNKLDKKLFHSQFYMLTILQVLFLVFFLSLFLFFSPDENRLFVLIMTVICMLIVNTRFMLLFLLQATNKIKEYSRVTILDKILYAILISSFLIVSLVDFKLMIVFDLIGKLISLLYAMYLCKDIVFQNRSSFYLSFSEAYENIRVGIKLMFSNIASSLIIGVVRFGIERSWSVAIFGKVSLTLSISGLMMIFINTLGIILYPILRRSPKENLSSIYNTIRDFLMVILFAILIIYYPVKEILILWLPNYEDGLQYMALLFPMLVYEGKTALLINTYLKTLRKEKLMLKINLLVLTLSIFITVFTTIILRSLDLAILSIILIIALRSILFEVFLSRLLKITVLKDIILELFMTVLFISTAWFIDSWIIVVLYSIGYLLYLILKFKDISRTIVNLKDLIKKD